MTQENIEEMLEKPYWIVDILPERVPKDSPGRYFAIEQYFLEESRRKNRVYTRETMMTGGPGIPGGPMMEGPDMEHGLYAQEAPDSDDMAENH